MLFRTDDDGGVEIESSFDERTNDIVSEGSGLYASSVLVAEGFGEDVGGGDLPCAMEVNREAFSGSRKRLTFFVVV